MKNADFSIFFFFGKNMENSRKYLYIAYLWLFFTIQGAPGSVRVGSVPTGSGSYRFRFKKIQKNEKISFFVFFSSGMGSGPSRVAPWTPWINIKIHLFFIFLIFYIFSLFRYKRPFNTINRCWDPSRMIENDLELHPVLISYFFER